MKTILAGSLLLIIAILISPSTTVFSSMAAASTLAETTVFDPTAETLRVDSAVPTDVDALFSYLKKGSYKSLAAQESRPHPTRGPHTDLGWPVRVFLDPVINASLEAGNKSHPVGSSIVKEMFNDKGDLQGWAVMVKTQDDSAGGKGWFWYETTNTTNASDPVAAGNGVQLCQGCHSIGKDFVLTTFPLQ